MIARSAVVQAHYDRARPAVSVAETLVANAPRVFDAIAKSKAERSFLDFVELMWPVLNPGNRFVRGFVQETIAEYLEAVHAGTILKLLINVPPGFTKSLLVNVMFCAWEWGPKRRPDLRYISWSYDAKLTERDNSDCRKIISSEIYQRLWGQCEVCKKRKPNAPRCATCETEKRFRLIGDQNTKQRYENDWGGFRFASSTGGAGTGWRGDRLIFDDPHSVMSAESDAQRQDAVNWFAATLPSRVRNTDGSMKRTPLPKWVQRAWKFSDEEVANENATSSATIGIMQRVHLKDISGVILATPELGYTVVLIEMEYLGDEHPARQVDVETGRVPLPDPPIPVRDPRKRWLQSVPALVEPTDPESWAACTWADLCNVWIEIGLDLSKLADPIRYPRHKLEELKTQMRQSTGSDAIESQLQQWPQEPGGTMFPESAVRYIFEEELLPSRSGTETRGYDLAASEKPGAAATVGVRLYIDIQDRIMIRNSAKVRGGPEKVDALIVGTSEEDGPDVVIDIPQDPAAGGIYMIHSFVRKLHGRTVEYSTEATKGKIARASPISAQWKIGNVFIVRTGNPIRDAWIPEFVRIVKQFPVGTWKDEVDAMTRAYDSQVRAAPLRRAAPPQIIQLNR